MHEDSVKNLLSELRNAREKHLKSEEIEILFKLAEQNYNFGDFEKAVVELKDVLKINPEQKYVNFFIAINYIELGNNNLAERYLKRELKLNPNDEKTLEILEKIEINANFPLITCLLILLNSIVFFFTFPKITLTNLIKFSAYSDSIGFFNLFTSLFFHVNLLHFGVNMVFLLMFGLILEKHIGSLKFLIAYVISGLIGNFVQALLTENSFVIGASAAIFGILGFLVMRLPLLDLRVFGIVKMPAIIVFGAFFGVSSIAFYSAEFFDFSSGDIAHLFGFLCGILIAGSFYRKTIDVFYNWLFIFFGFWIFSYTIKKLFTMKYFYFFEVINVIFLCLVSLILVFYSYEKLKMIVKKEDA